MVLDAVFEEKNIATNEKRQHYAARQLKDNRFLYGALEPVIQEDGSVKVSGLLYLFSPSLQKNITEESYGSLPFDTLFADVRHLSRPHQWCERHRMDQVAFLYL